jgi:hypothetical protein
MGLTTSQSQPSLASALTAEQMRAIARCSRHDNTVAVPALPATSTPDVWPGEPDHNEPELSCWCGYVGPIGDFMPLGMGGGCLDCYLQRRPRP